MGLVAGVCDSRSGSGGGGVGLELLSGWRWDRLRGW